MRETQNSFHKYATVWCHCVNPVALSCVGGQIACVISMSLFSIVFHRNSSLLLFLMIKALYLKEFSVCSPSKSPSELQISLCRMTITIQRIFTAV